MIEIYGTVYNGEDFAYRDYTRQSFSNFDFNDVNFTSSIFKGASFHNCTFRNCNFSHCDLTGARFYDCLVHRCNFKKANLHNCIGIINGEFDTLFIEPYLCGSGSIVFWTQEAVGNKKFIINYYENILLEEFLTELEDRMKLVVITGQK